MVLIASSNPDSVSPPTSGHSHAVLLEGAGRRLLISGQVGRAPDGGVPGGEAQIALAWANVRAILTAHGMGPRDVVRTTLFVTDRALVAPLRAARDAFFEGHAPASTLLIVAGLGDPRCVVEVEAEAAA